MSKRYDGLLICSDFDGTLALDGAISRENADAIRHFQSHGGLFTFASGRNPELLWEQESTVRPNTYMVTLGGAMICKRSRSDAIRKCTLPPETFPPLRGALPALEGIRSVIGYAVDSLSDVLVEGDENRAIIPLVPENFDRIDALFAHPLYKLVFHTEKDCGIPVRDALRRIMGERYEISRSWDTGVEILLRENGKGSGVRFLADFVGASTLICVGDYENDLSMLHKADMGCAVGDAVPSLLAVADRILPPARDHAIAHLIESL